MNAPDRSAQPVDVLAVMDDRANAIESKWPKAYADGLREARAAVAELVEAAEFASNVCAELYAKYQLKVGPFASQAQVANGKLRAALARMGSQP